MKSIKWVGLFVGIIVVSIGQGVCQTNLQFTGASATAEGAIRLSWASTNTELYEIDEADSLVDTNTGSTTWNLLYNNYPSQGTNTFWLDAGNYNLAPQILHPKYMPMRFYRIVDLGPDTTSDEPNVSILSPASGTNVSGELMVTVLAGTDQPVLSGTKLYVDGQEMPMADSTTNWTDGSTNYEMDTYSVNACEWLNGTHVLFATTECESGYSVEPNSGPVTTGHGVSPFVSVIFSNLVEGISFSQPTFDPSSGQTQQISAVFAANSDWTLDIVDVNTNVVLTATGSGTSMSYDWDGTGTGETNLPTGLYFYYISAETNGESSDVVTGGSGGGGGGSPPSPDFASSAFGGSEASSLWAVPAGSTGDATPVPLALYPPGFDTNSLTIFEASDADIALLRPSTTHIRAAGFRAMGASADDDGGGGGGPAGQNAPPAPQRPPNNPVRGLAGTFGIAYDTYTANGTNNTSIPPLANEPGITGSYIQMESFSASAHIPYGPMPQHVVEANTFVSQMQHFGWSNPLNEADGQLNIGSLRGSGTPFNNVNLGVLILHGTYGNSQDYMAGLCKQMYFPITSGGGGQYLRFSEMNLGRSGANGLKWMVIDACHSLYHVNWSSMKNMGIKPYNGNLHLILGGDTDTYTSAGRWYNFARYMNYGRHNFYSPYTIRNAYYQGNIDAFANAPLPPGTTITLAVAGDSACLDDSLQTNTPPSGSWTYTSQPVFSN